MGITPRISLRQVAAQAGVSHSTVSLSLRNHPSIPSATRQRIRTVAESMGYRPDPMLTALNVYRQSRRSTAVQSSIAWINPFPVKDTLHTNPDFDAYWEGAHERAREAGFNLTQFWLHEPGMTLPRINRILKSRHIQGVLLPPMPRGHALVDLPWDNFSTVAFGYSHEPVFHLVANAQYHTARLATRKLWALGYRRIALFRWPDIDARTDYNFSSGFFCECRLLDAPPLVCDVEDKPMRHQTEDRVHFKRWADYTTGWIKQNQPDALLLPDPTIALALGFAPPTGTTPVKPKPGTVGLAVLAHYPQQSWFAGVSQNPRRIGAAAANHLISMIQRNEKGKPDLPLRILVEGTWCDGASAPTRLA
jgi:DNA-binding LacI/PurR family transcriptional regulator